MVKCLNQELIWKVADSEFESVTNLLETRMNQQHPDKKLKTEIINSHQKAIVVDIARGGILPSLVVYEFLHDLLPQPQIRQDHIFAARVSDSQHHVSRTEITGAKIGGPKQDSFVFIPDPMGATGSTVSAVYKHYKEKVSGAAKKFIVLNLIVTPEYLKRLKIDCPEVIVYTFRLDRGLSSQAVLDSHPGSQWDQEKGLNEFGYIVPGGGGFGEVMNNSFV